METYFRQDGLSSRDAFRHNQAKKEQLDRAWTFLICFLSLLTLTLTQEQGTVAAAAFVFFSCTLALRRPKQAFFSVVENAPLFLIPALALISTAWSQYPEATFYGSLQFIVTTAIAIWLGTLVPRRTFIASLMLALTVINIIGLIIDGGASFRDDTPLIGEFGSKNQLAYHALMQLMAAIIVIWDRRQALIMRLVSVVSVLLAIVCLIQAQSTGAIVFGTPTILLCLFLPFVSRFSAMTRAIGVIALLATAAVAIIAVMGFVDDFGAVLDAVGKDSTLTGRSYLWQRAHEFINQAPLLGVGYEAFWRVGNPPAEDLWAASLVESGAGFNFHNIYLHIGVDLGYIGMGLVILTMAWLALRLCKAIIICPNLPVVFATATFASIFTTSFIEATFLGQFMIQQILLGVIWVYSDTSGLRIAEPRIPQSATPSRIKHPAQNPRPSA